MSTVRRSDLSVTSGPHGRALPDEIVVFDTETTGLLPFGFKDNGMPSGDPDGPDRLCSAAFLHFRRSIVDGYPWWTMVECLAFRVDPGRPVPEEASKINGFGWNPDGRTPGLVNLANGAPFRAMVGDINRVVSGRVLAAHNIVFDVAVVDAELARIGHPPLANKLVCSKKAFSEMQGAGRPNHYVAGTNLNRLCDVLGVDRSARVGPDGAEFHGAQIDALMAANCLFALDGIGWLILEEAADLPHHRLLPASCADLVPQP